MGRLKEEGYKPRFEVKGYYPLVKLVDGKRVVLRVEVALKDKELEPEALEDARGDSPGEYDETGGQVDPETLLKEAETRNQRLGEEVRRLCIKGLWDDQCKQLEESDCQLAAAEAEIAWLRRQFTEGKPPNSLFSQAGSGVVPESLLPSPPASGVRAVRLHLSLSS